MNATVSCSPVFTNGTPVSTHLDFCVDLLDFRDDLLAVCVDLLDFCVELSGVCVDLLGVKVNANHSKGQRKNPNALTFYN
jgi:hypothetical protein